MSLRSTVRTVGRVVVVITVAAVVAVAAWFAFVDYPGSLTDLLGLLVAIVAVVAAVGIAGRLANSLFPDYNVAEVAIEGPITRDGGGGRLPQRPSTPGADDIVEQIDRADADRHVEALLLKLNTPGGEVVPSDDIREAAREFDGPTIAYTTDLCASGGIWIASGCDERWAREGSLVGSIGVLFSQLRVADLLDEYGIAYERIVAGDYKDALSPAKPLEDDERDYLQAIADAWYERFVDRVADGTDMAPAEIRDTEARIYLGDEARDLGMVDELGDREAVETSLETRLDEPVRVQAFEPAMGIAKRLRGTAAAVAYAFGAGIGTAVRGDEGGLRMR